MDTNSKTIDAAIEQATGIKPGEKSFLQQYIDTPDEEKLDWLEAQPWYQALPDERTHEDQEREKRCPYGCDEGNIIRPDREGVMRGRPCPYCRFGFTPTNATHQQETTKEPHRQYLMLSDQLSRENWEGWPVEDFEEFKYSPNFVDTQSNQAGWRLRNKIERGGNGFLAMIGQSGRGKTYTALQVLSFAAQKGLHCGAYNFKDLVELLRKGIDAKEQVAKRWNVIKSIDVLLLDEVGDEAGSRADHAETWITGIVREYQHKKTLIITSNLSEKKFSSYLPNKIISRVTGGWGEIIYESEGQKDLRDKELF